NTVCGEQKMDTTSARTFRLTRSWPDWRRALISTIWADRRWRAKLVGNNWWPSTKEISTSTESSNLKVTTTMHSKRRMGRTSAAFVASLIVHHVEFRNGIGASSFPAVLFSQKRLTAR